MSTEHRPPQDHDDIVDAFVARASTQWRPASADADAFDRRLRARRARRQRRRSALTGLIAAVVAGGVWLAWPTMLEPAQQRIVSANEPRVMEHEAAEQPEQGPTVGLRVLEPWVAATVPGHEAMTPGLPIGSFGTVYADLTRDERVAQREHRPPPPRPVQILRERGDEFGLSAESIEAMIEIAESATNERRELRDAIDAARAALESVLLDPDPSDDDMTEALRALTEAEFTLRQFDLRVMLQMRALLSDEELDAFREMFPRPGHPPPPPPRHRPPPR